MPFQPDHRYVMDVMANVRPDRLPLYEHKISPLIMEQVLGVNFAELENGDRDDMADFFGKYCHFHQQMTYDTVSYEVTLSRLLPEHGAIYGGRSGPIQTRDDFEKYPWDEIPERYWSVAGPKFQALCDALPPGMKAIGGIGNGAFELSEDLVGFQQLAYMMVDDPDLFADLYQKIGDLSIHLWTTFLERYNDHFCVCRFGDDLGFRSSTLVSPKTIRQHIVPQYRRVISLIKEKGKPFLWHSCGKIFSVMDDVIALGINAKHSNEDNIAPFDEWIHRYSGRIALLGGIDVDLICQSDPQTVFDLVVERGIKYRTLAKGYALGSGNSIPEYVPVEGYLAMVRAAQHIRQLEVDLL